MAQVMVNFRLDEEVKRTMEQACREMGLSMTTAFTIFARKVGKEKRIPFEITAEPRRPGPYRRQPLPGDGEAARRQKRLEGLCAGIRRSLTAIHTAIPASITGLTMERIRLLCGDELKDKAAGASAACKALFSGASAGLLEQKDPAVLDRYTEGLAAIAAELRDIEGALVPAMKACPGTDSDGFEPYRQRLAAVSGMFDALSPVMREFLSSTAPNGGAQAVGARIRRAAAPVGTPYVRSAVDSLEGLVLRSYDSLPERDRARLEADYLPTLELTLGELAQAEREGAGGGGEAALCLRVVNVLTQAISDGAQARQEWNRRSLEAEVAALERLAAARGDLPGGMTPGG